MNRVKRIAEQILEIHGDIFTDDFEKNKEILVKISVIRSKQIRNEVAGFITKMARSKSTGEAEMVEAVTAEAVKPSQ